jgi:hypothetical protein
MGGPLYQFVAEHGDFLGGDQDVGRVQHEGGGGLQHARLKTFGQDSPWIAKSLF